MPGDWKTENTHRKQRLNEICQKYGVALATGLNKTAVFPVKQMYVDDKHGLIFCEVPKVGCTNWKRILLALTENFSLKEALKIGQGNIHAQVMGYVTPMARFSEKGRQFRLKKYLKFMFVRHPLERIISAFRDKFENNNIAYQIGIGKRIINKYRNHSAGHIMQNGKGVTFKEFAKYLIDEGKSKRTYPPVDVHWATYHTLCDPCSIQYDVIGKHETLQIDANNILKMAGSDLTFPESQNKNKTNVNTVSTYLSQLDASDKEKLWKTYEMDSEMFDYKSL